MKTVQIEIPASLANRISTHQDLLTKLVVSHMERVFPPKRQWVVDYPYGYDSDFQIRNENKRIRNILGIPDRASGRRSAGDLTIRDLEHVRGYRSNGNGSDYIIKERIKWKWSERPIRYKTFMRYLRKDLKEASQDHE